MSGGRVELGLGAGWFEAEHTAYGIPFPDTGRAVRPARGAARGHHRAVGDPAGRALHLRRPALPGDRLARRCPSRCSSPRPPVIVGGDGTEAHARRWPPGTPTSSTCRSSSVDDDRASSSRGSAPPATRSAGTRHRCAGRTRWSVCCGSDEAECPPARRGDRPRAGRAARERRRRHPGRGGRDDRPVRRRAAPSGSTCRCSTSTTSTTSSWSRPRSCRRSDPSRTASGLGGLLQRRRTPSLSPKSPA